MFLTVILLIVGMILLIKGADLFVSGSSKLAKAIKIPPLVIGLTLVSMGTSAPEASVSINSAISGMTDMGISNVVGSNIFNTLFIVGLSAAITPLAFGRDAIKYDLPIMTLLYCVLAVFAFLCTPMTLDLFEGVVLLALFAAYTAFIVVRAMRGRSASAPVKQYPLDSADRICAPVIDTENGGKRKKPRNKRKVPLWLSVILAIIGLAGVIFGGDLVVDSAAKIAVALGMSEAMVGLTIVAVGTSLPELVTSAVAAVKKENDIALGNVIGSNIFNMIFILGLSSAVRPAPLDLDTLADLFVMLCSGMILMPAALHKGKVGRIFGVMLILAYAAYLSFIIVRS